MANSSAKAMSQKLPAISLPPPCRVRLHFRRPFPNSGKNIPEDLAQMDHIVKTYSIRLDSISRIVLRSKNLQLYIPIFFFGVPVVL